MREFNRENFKNADERLDSLENNIYKEISDRVTESDHTISETQARLTRKFTAAISSLPVYRVAKRLRCRG